MCSWNFTAFPKQDLISSDTSLTENTNMSIFYKIVRQK